MTTQLTRYEAARAALVEARRVDEVKDIRDKAEAMAAYARQAKDVELVQYATEIKVRAERRCGEMLRESAKRGERSTGGKPSKDTTVSTLASIGISRDQSSKWQRLAAMPAEGFEGAVATAKNSAGQVTTAGMLRAARSPGKPIKTRRAKAMRHKLDKSQVWGGMLSMYVRLALRALKQQSRFDDHERELLRELRDCLASLLGESQDESCR